MSESCPSKQANTLMRRWLALSADDSFLDEALGLLVAACGFATQWIWRFDLPFVLDIVMFPFHLLEWYLRFTITH